MKNLFGIHNLGFKKRREKGHWFNQTIKKLNRRILLSINNNERVYFDIDRTEHSWTVRFQTPISHLLSRRQAAYRL